MAAPDPVLGASALCSLETPSCAGVRKAWSLAALSWGGKVEGSESFLVECQGLLLTSALNSTFPLENLVLSNLQLLAGLAWPVS